jgi:hypothetical protein
MTTSPFVYRLLIPYSLGLVLPAGWLDAYSLKYLFAAGSVWLTLYLMPAFARRACGLELTGLRAVALLATVLLVLVCHYCLPRPFMFYYIYDLPAIPFYMAAFLLLTRQRASLTWSGIAFVLLASLNRETVVIAVFHALAWHAAQLRPQTGVQLGGQTAEARSRFSQIKPVLIQSSLAVGLMVLLRMLISHGIKAAGDGNAALMEGDQIRVVANIQRVLAYDLHARALLFFGAGALAWLPWGSRYFPKALKLMTLASIVPLLILLVVGNMVELRIYSEFVPLLGLGLYLTLAALAGKFRAGAKATT